MNDGTLVDAREVLAAMRKCWCCGKIPLGAAMKNPETQCSCDLYNELGEAWDGKCSDCAAAIDGAAAPAESEA